MKQDPQRSTKLRDGGKAFTEVATLLAHTGVAAIDAVLETLRPEDMNHVWQALQDHGKQQAILIVAPAPGKGPMVRYGLWQEDCGALAGLVTTTLPARWQGSRPVVVLPNS